MYEHSETIYGIHKQLRRNGHNHALQNKLQGHESILRRLQPHRQLQGHTGRVNRLSWHDNQRLLVSGGDDNRVLIWDCSSGSASPLHSVDAGHSLHISGVAFLGDSHVVSSGLDKQVRLSSIADSGERTLYSCHKDRVKHLATIPGNSNFLWWTSGKDGTIRQFDSRVAHTCRMREDCGNVLVDLSCPSVATGRTVLKHSSERWLSELIYQQLDLRRCRRVILEAEESLEGALSNRSINAVAINPVQPEYIACAAGDPLIRVYDRRMLSLHTPGNPLVQSRRTTPCHVFVPQHLWSHPFRSNRKNGNDAVLSSSHVSWSPDGRLLAATYSGEQLYVFPFRGNQPTTHYPIPPLSNEVAAPKNILTVDKIPFISGSHYRRASNQGDGSVSNVKVICTEANSLMEIHRYSEAIARYSKALRFTSNPLVRSSLLCDRAFALVHRNTRGDALAAERDALEALYFDPSNRTAILRRIQANCAGGRLVIACRITYAAAKAFAEVPLFRNIYKILVKRLNRRSSNNRFSQSKSVLAGARAPQAAEVSQAEAALLRRSLLAHTRFLEDNLNTTAKTDERSASRNSGRSASIGARGSEGSSTSVVSLDWMVHPSSQTASVRAQHEDVENNMRDMRRNIMCIRRSFIEEYDDDRRNVGSSSSREDPLASGEAPTTSIRGIITFRAPLSSDTLMRVEGDPLEDSLDISSEVFSQYVQYSDKRSRIGGTEQDEPPIKGQVASSSSNQPPTDTTSQEARFPLDWSAGGTSTLVGEGETEALDDTLLEELGEESLEQSLEATQPFWLHPRIGFSFRYRISGWRGWMHRYESVRPWWERCLMDAGSHDADDSVKNRRRVFRSIFSTIERESQMDSAVDRGMDWRMRSSNLRYLQEVEQKSLLTPPMRLDFPMAMRRLHPPSLEVYTGRLPDYLSTERRRGKYRLDLHNASLLEATLAYVQPYTRVGSEKASKAAIGSSSSPIDRLRGSSVRPVGAQASLIPKKVTRMVEDHPCRLQDMDEAAQSRERGMPLSSTDAAEAHEQSDEDMLLYPIYKVPVEDRQSVTLGDRVDPRLDWQKMKRRRLVQSLAASCRDPWDSVLEPKNGRGRLREAEKRIDAPSIRERELSKGWGDSEGSDASTDEEVASQSTSRAPEGLIESETDEGEDEKETDSVCSSLGDDFEDWKDDLLAWPVPAETINAVEHIEDVDWVPFGDGQRFVGHSNAYGISEVGFWGNDAIISGSDHGSVFIWRCSDGELLNVLQSHKETVMSVQAQPGGALLATSGDEKFIQLWKPSAATPFLHDAAVEKIMQGNKDLLMIEDMSFDSFANFARGAFTTFNSIIQRASPMISIGCPIQ